MAQSKTEGKMILAIIRGEDSADAVSALNHNGFYVTVLSTVGGFLRQKSATLLICTQANLVDKALDVLKKTAGRRMEPTCQPSSMPQGVVGTSLRSWPTNFVNGSTFSGGRFAS